VLQQQEEPLSLDEIAHHTGIARTTAHRLLHNLSLQGYIEKDPERYKYRLGVKLAELGSAVKRRQSLRDIALQPMQGQIDQNTVFNAIAPVKDLDCVNPANIGHVLLGDFLFAPATPSACIEILDREGVELQGLDVTIVNHSNIVGKPAALLCLNRNASVHVVHVFSKDVPAACRQADVLICAAPVQNLIKRDMVKPGAVVVDVTTIRHEGKQVGSLEFDGVREVAAKVTPVPGGVGPVTNVILLKNALAACKAQTGAA